MANALVESTARYGLLHFSPYPERGDRVCVGIWFDDGKQITIDYDQRFHQLRCLAPAFNVKFVRLLLDDLSKSLREAGRSGAEFVMKQYEPQLVSTEARRIVAPLTRELQDHLRNKFLFSSRELAAIDRVSTGVQRMAHDEAAQRVRDYVRSLIPDRETRILERVTPYTLFGIRSQINKTPTVALAVQRPRELVVIDGVDLNALPAKRVVTRVDQIVYAFWQFGRVREQGGLFSDQRALRRVGIVLNGVSVLDRAALEAHDYAIDRFKAEAEVTVDTSTNEGREQLIATLTD